MADNNEELIHKADGSSTDNIVRGESNNSTENASESSWVDVSKSAESCNLNNNNTNDINTDHNDISTNNSKNNNNSNETNDANNSNDTNYESDDTDEEIDNVLKSAKNNETNNNENDTNDNNDNNAYVSIDHKGDDPLAQEAAIEKNIEKALTHKSKGNEFYKLKSFDEAIDEYSHAIELCPEETEKDNRHLSIFYGNRAACYIAVEEYDAALEDCNVSLEYNETYIKALWRRAQVHEKLEKYTDSSQDYKKILEIDPSQTLLVTPHIERLKPKVEQEFEEQKKEVVDKLKTFANWGLGKLGLSLNNFDAKQDPNTGSYNIQFNPNPSNTG